MSTQPHTEHHFRATATLRDIVIGMSDGLTVPFALAAGLSGAVVQNAIIVTAGLAEIAAGSIAMGLGGYLAARTEQEHYQRERAREVRETIEVPEVESEEVAAIFRAYGVSAEQAKLVVQSLRQDQGRWVDFMMRFELGLEPPDPHRARISALTIGAAYVAGGIIPLTPYLAIPSPSTALALSAGVTMLALFVFGYVKGRFTGITPLRIAFQTVAIGTLAASAAFVIARLIS